VPARSHVMAASTTTSLPGGAPGDEVVMTAVECPMVGPTSAAHDKEEPAGRQGVVDTDSGAAVLLAGVTRRATIEADPLDVLTATPRMSLGSWAAGPAVSHGGARSSTAAAPATSHCTHARPDALHPRGGTATAKNPMLGPSVAGRSSPAAVAGLHSHVTVPCSGGPCGGDRLGFTTAVIRWQSVVHWALGPRRSSRVVAACGPGPHLSGNDQRSFARRRALQPRQDGPRGSCMHGKRAP